MRAIFWFRRDLRLEDNHGLYRALEENAPVVPVFIFDKHILSRLEDKDDARLTFIYDEVGRLKNRVEKFGSSLIVRFGEPVSIIEGLAVEFSIGKVYANHDYEPYARERDEEVARSLRALNVSFITVKDQVIFEKDDILKADGKPYTVFTPYMKQWKAAFAVENTEAYNTEKYVQHFYRMAPRTLPSLEELGFRRSSLCFPGREIDEELIASYDKTRDIPSLEGTSRLGIHLRFGTISIRKLVRTAAKLNEVFLNELIWREFYMMILWHFPHVEKSSFKPRYDRIPWRNDEAEFRAWCEGHTGYPIVDAGMRQLNETGYMHNRLRMVTASFLTKLLLIDWRWGEAYFARKLLDYELSSNNGGWQWSAGSGCDSAPYFRIFSPDSQTNKFDPQGSFIKRWVAEKDDEQYPAKLVEYSSARKRALEVYRKALQ